MSDFDLRHHSHGLRLTSTIEPYSVCAPPPLWRALEAKLVQSDPSESRCLFRAGDGTVIRFRFVDEHRSAHRVKRMCDVLGWDRSSCHAWRQCGEGRREKADAEEVPAGSIRVMHTDSRGAYGARRITQALRDRGNLVNRQRVARMLREREIVGMTRRKPRSLMKQDRTAPPA